MYILYLGTRCEVQSISYETILILLNFKVIFNVTAKALYEITLPILQINIRLCRGDPCDTLFI